MNIFDEHLPPVSTQQEETPRSNKRRVEGVSKFALRKGAIQLEELAGEAFDTLRDAMRFAEFPVAVQAAKLVLDRSGFGPTSTIKIDDVTDLDNFTTEELAAIALTLEQDHQSESKSNVIPINKAIH